MLQKKQYYAKTHCVHITYILYHLIEKSGGHATFPHLNVSKAPIVDSVRRKSIQSC